MAYTKRSYKTKYRKRRVNKNYQGRSLYRRSNAPSRSISRLPVTGFPPTLLMKMKYVTPITAIANAGNSYCVHQVFRANDLYDPDYTGTGHQPLYFDELCLVYGRFVVYGVLIEITAALQNASSPCGIAINAKPTVTSQPLAVTAEKPESKYIMVNGGAKAVKFSRYYDIAKLFGISRDALFSEDAYTGTSSTSPSTQQYIIIASGPPDTNTGLTLNYNVELTYYVKWKQRNNIGSS